MNKKKRMRSKDRMHLESNYVKLLLDFANLPKPKSTKTFLEISGYPHYENVASNILAFYLDPQEEHDLGDLVLASLLEACGEKDTMTERATIVRELGTGGGQLDLFIETESHVIGIENKIFHHLHNDLSDYANCLEGRNQNGRQTLKVVLSPRPVSDELLVSGFINTLYEEVWQALERRLGERVGKAQQKWVVFLTEFIQTIRNLAGMNIELRDTDRFFIENNETIENLFNDWNEFQGRIRGRLRQIHELCDSDPSVKEKLSKAPWFYQGSCLVFEFHKHGEVFKLDLHIRATGWVLTLFGQSHAGHAKLKNQVKAEGFFKSPRDTDTNQRYIVRQWELTEETDLIFSELSGWINRTKALLDNLPEAAT